MNMDPRKRWTTEPRERQNQLDILKIEIPVKINFELWAFFYYFVILIQPDFLNPALKTKIYKLF